jgi:hypothetical protein
MHFLRIAPEKKNTWYYRAYLVVQAVLVVPVVLVIGGTWFVKYRNPHGGVSGGEFLGIGLGVWIPSVLLWLGLRIMLFIFHGEHAFGSARQPPKPPPIGSASA